MPPILAQSSSRTWWASSPFLMISRYDTRSRVESVRPTSKSICLPGVGPKYVAGHFAFDIRANQRTIGHHDAPLAEGLPPFFVAELAVDVHVHAVVAQRIGDRARAAAGGGRNSVARN